MVLFSKSVATKAYLLSHRAFSTTNANNFSYLIKSLPRPLKKVPHPEHVKSINLWRNLFFIAGIPALLLINYNITFLEDHHPPRPHYAPYEYMRKRAKKFPWGDGNHTLFHNPYYNALPEGYEVEEGDHGHEH